MSLKEHPVISTGKSFFNTNVNKKVCIFNKSVLDVLSNFIPQEDMLYDGENPWWFNSRIKSLLQVKNKVFQNYRKSKPNIQLRNKFNFVWE